MDELRRSADASSDARPAGHRRASADPGDPDPRELGDERGTESGIPSVPAPQGSSDHRGRTEVSLPRRSCERSERPAEAGYLGKMTVTLMMTGTATPFSIDGSYSHCETASTAA